jgi:glucosamine--fructose-6-phosphate aminotransferase (isomerizing)
VWNNRYLKHTSQYQASIINSLKKLEYRGYDSAGIATLSDGFINEVKSEGRVDEFRK